MTIRINIINKTFERLKVIKQVEPCGKDVKYLCKCSCGREVSVYGKNLLNGNTKSCGCYNGCHKYNKYDLTGEYGIGYTSKGEEFYFDLEDYDKIKDCCWYKNDKGYMASHDRSSKLKKDIIKLNNLLMDDKMINYINKDRCDNRKNNLKKTTKSQSGINRKIGTNNTSGYTGVCKDKRTGKWKVQIMVNSKHSCLGYFSDLNEAIKTRKLAEESALGYD